MMRILEASGLVVQTDGERQADRDNPEGYYEWKAIKKVGTRPGILLEAEGKVIKVVSMLLPSLPPRHRYKVIFMDRPIEEVVASQARMLHNRGAGETVAETGKITEMLRAHRAEILRGLHNTPGFEVLTVDYPYLVRAPERWAPRIQSFLGIALPLQAVRSAIRPELYRNRTQ